MKTTIDAYKAPISEVLENFSTSVETGLSRHVSDELRKAEGANASNDKNAFFPLLMLLAYVLPSLAVAGVLFRAGDMVTGTMVTSATLVMAAGLYALVHRVVVLGGRRRHLKAAMENKQVSVVREGTITNLRGSQLVPGDILLYDKTPDVTLPADCRLLPGHDMRISQTWQYGWLDGTRLENTTDFLAAGTVLQVATATCVVIATGDKRYIAKMYADHPAGPLVRSLWHAGLWYALGVAILLSAGALQGMAATVAYALAVGTPVLLPYFFIKKGRGLRMQSTSTIPDHLLYPIEQLLIPKPRESLILLRDHIVPLRELKKASESTQNTVAQFLELMALCVREDAATRHGALLLRVVADARRQGLEIDSMETWSQDPELSRTIFKHITGTYGYISSFVQRDDDQENSLHLACDDAATVLAKCTYLWDDKEHTMRRRFFSGEKQQLAEMLREQAEMGNIAYGLALRENSHEDAPWIYIGAVVIPRQVQKETLEELHSYAGNGHAVVFYSECGMSPIFARDSLKIPAKHIFTSGQELAFNNLRRNDFFLTMGIDAVQLRDLQDRLAGGVLVDTMQDRFVSSLYFWPRHMRFNTASTTSFFQWLTLQAQSARDALTKGAQYAGMLTILALSTLGLLLARPEMADDRVFLFVATTSIALGLVALLGHVTDKQANPVRVQQLAFLDIQQAMTGLRILAAAIVTGGAYLALVHQSLTVTATMPLELVFFLLVGVAAAVLSRFAMDTPSMPHALLFAGAYILLTVPVYFLFFAANSLLAGDTQWLFGAAILLGGITWIVASYQAVPQRRL